MEPNLEYKVKKVLDGNTIVVEPLWTWKEHSKNLVMPVGIQAPRKGHPGFSDARDKMKMLALNKIVELRNFVDIDRGRLRCDVFLLEKNLADYFPEYRV